MRKLLILLISAAPGLLLQAAMPVQAQPKGERLTPEQYIEQWKTVAVKKMEQHGIPASITLAQGLLESGNGNSRLAREANNHFGIKCHSDWTGGKVYHDDDRRGECFRKYRHASESFEDHAKFLQRSRYADLFKLNATDYKGWAHGLKRAGYATDPKYAPKLIALIERYELQQLDRGVDIVFQAPASQPPTTGSKPQRGGGGTVVTVGGGRQVDVFQGRIKFVRAKEGDDFRKLAHDLEMTHGMLARWNDMDKNASLTAGQRVYIQPKRAASKATAIHIARDGEDLWSVSQEHGVKLKRLAKYNDLPTDAGLSAGQQIHLRKPGR